MSNVEVGFIELTLYTDASKVAPLKDHILVLIMQ